jgi:glycosyltransferase involved in cell wall biosynthesis
MACGCPVVVSRGAAVHEVLTDQKTALLFPARQPEALATAVERLISNPALRKQIAEQGRQLILKHYNWEEFARQIAKVSEEVSRSH